MMVELGKRYQLRDGRYTHPLEMNAEGNPYFTSHPFRYHIVGGGSFTVTPTGLVGTTKETCGLDLVAELVTPGAPAVPVSTGVRLDNGKPRWSLLPFDAVGEVVKVFTFGAAKYSDNNWRLPGIKWGQHHSAAQRHLAAFWEGEDREEESKLYHLAHACCDILMLLASTMLGYGTDDRPKKGNK